MKAKKILFSIVAVLCGLVFAASIVFFAYDNFFFDIKQLPEGEHIVSVTTPGDRFTIAMYKVQNNMGTAVRGELFDNKTKTTKNVYWETATDKTEVFWLNETMVSINGNVVDVTVDTFDSRRPIINDIEDAILAKGRK